jgi:hypothetical protein
MTNSSTNAQGTTSVGNGFLAYPPEWVTVREALEDSLIHGDPLPEWESNELVRHGLRIGHFLDMSDKGRAREMFLLGWLPWEIAHTLGMDDALVAQAVGRINPETWTIIHGHAQGMSVQAIHMSTEFSRAWIYKVLAARGLTPNIQAGRAQELSARKKEEVLRRWRAGEPIASISTRTGATINQVNYIARKNRR